MQYRFSIAGFLLFFMALVSGIVPIPGTFQPEGQTATVLTQTPKLSIHSLTIGGISSLSTEAQVRTRLGKPQQVEEKYWQCCGKIRILNYDRTKVQLVQNGKGNTFTVFAVSTQNPKFATQNGVRVGDTRQKVIAQYGPSRSTKQEGKGTILYYYLDALAASLIFTVEGDRVVAIGFYEDLN